MDGENASANSMSLQRLVYLFRLVVTKRSDSIKEVADTANKDPSLLTRQLTFLCGSIFDVADTGCACVSDHECFTYVSGSKLDEDRFNEIIKSIESGKCIHYESLPEEDEEEVGPMPTSVDLIHAAAAVGNVPVMKLLLKTEEDKPGSSNSMHLSPLHVAMIHNQMEIVDTILLEKNDKVTEYCHDLWYKLPNHKNRNVVDCYSLSTFAFFLKTDDFLRAAALLKHASLRTNWMKDAFESGKESALNLITPYFDEQFVDHLEEKDIILLLQMSVERGYTEIAVFLCKHYIKKGWNKKNASTVPLIATVMNRAQILEVVLKMDLKAKENRYLTYTLLDISELLGHSECSNVLRTHGVPSTKAPSSPFLDILEIVRDFRLSTRISGMLIKQVGLRHSVKQDTKNNETMLLYSLKHLRGLGARALLTAGDDVEAIDKDGLNPLSLTMNHDTDPRLLFDLLYYNPEMKFCQERNVDKSRRHLALFDRSTTANITILALAIERDLKNYSIRKWAMCYSGFTIYEGSISVLLIDCGYDVRNDDLVKGSYISWLSKQASSARENEIRARILQRIESELFHPKLLTERCRDVLRRELHGNELHRYLCSVEMPKSVKDFILMEKRLTQTIGKRSDGRTFYCINIEED